MLNKIVVIITACVSGVVVMGAQSAQSALERAAGEDRLTFAMMLADASIPSGVVLSKSDYQRVIARPPFSGAKQPRAVAEELIQTFNARHSREKAALMDGVLVIGGAAGLPSALQKKSGLKPMEVKGVLSAAQKVMAALDPTLGGSGGSIGSAIGVNPEQRGDALTIVFDGTEDRIVDGLNAIAKQSQKAWLIVVTDERPDAKVVRVAIIHRGGASTGVDLSGTARD